MTFGIAVGPRVEADNAERAAVYRECSVRRRLGRAADYARTTILAV